MKICIHRKGLKVMVGPIIVAAVVVFILIMFFSFVPVGLWISSMASGVRVGIFTLIGMRLRRVVPARIILPLIKATKPVSHCRSTS